MRAFRERLPAARGPLWLAWALAGAAQVLALGRPDDAVTEGAVAVWFLGWVLFEAALFLPASREGASGGMEERRPRPESLVVQAESALIMTLAIPASLGPAFLLLVTMQIAAELPLRSGLAWAVGLTAVAGLGWLVHWGLEPALSAFVGLFGLQCLVMLLRSGSVSGAASAPAARDAPVRLSQPAPAAPALAPPRAAVAEAPSVGAQDPPWPEPRVPEALQDPRDLGRLLHSLSEAEAGTRVHLSMPPDLGVRDRTRADLLLEFVRVLLRCLAADPKVEEIWLVLDREGPEVSVHARNDGAWAPSPDVLLDVQRRWRRLGGVLAVVPRRARGLRVDGRLPVPAAAA